MVFRDLDFFLRIERKRILVVGNSMGKGLEVWKMFDKMDDDKYSVIVRFKSGGDRNGKKVWKEF